MLNKRDSHLPGTCYSQKVLQRDSTLCTVLERVDVFPDGTFFTVSVYFRSELTFESQRDLGDTWNFRQELGPRLTCVLTNKTETTRAMGGLGSSNGTFKANFWIYSVPELTDTVCTFEWPAIDHSVTFTLLGSDLTQAFEQIQKIWPEQ